MGPILVLDKSAFQSLSKGEHLFLEMYFMQNLTPTLAMELLGDLSKKTRDQRTSQQVVSELAGKFGGSGPAVNLDYRTLCYNSLLGVQVPMTQRIIPDNHSWSTAPDGSKGLFIDLSPFNHAILRWANGEFSQFEHELSHYWREKTTDLSLDSLTCRLSEHHVVFPQVAKTDEIPQVADRLLSTASLQSVFLEWFVDQFGLSDGARRLIRSRWHLGRSLLLRDFAPYAYYCLRVLLCAVLAMRSGLVKWKPTNVLDLQYLYYAPFCMALASDDAFHQVLAPLVIGEDQSFVRGKELKADLRRISEHWDGLSEKQQQWLRDALGSYPPPANHSIVHELWKKHMRPWRPGSGSLISDLPDSELREAIAWVERMFRDTDGEAYFMDPPN